MVSVSKSIETFQYDPQRSSFKGWLFTIIKRKFIDLRRSQKRKKHLLHTDLDQSAAEISMMSAEASQGEGPDQQLWERDWEAFVKERTFKRLKERFKIEYLQIFDLAVNKGVEHQLYCRTSEDIQGKRLPQITPHATSA